MTSSSFQSLPSELIMSILELALMSIKPSILATISKAVRLHLNEVLYRTIILSSSHIIRALHHTALTSPHLLLLVKKLVSTYDPSDFSKGGDWLDTELQTIVGACKNLHALTLRDFTPLPDLAEHRCLEEITFPSFIDTRTKASPTGSNAVKRLRFAEPTDYGWVSPSEMMSALGNPQNLTHLQLSRRAGANEDNDKAFRDDIVTILRNYRELKVLVVSVFNGYAWWSEESSTKESYLWKTMEELKERDGRVVVLEGQRSEWAKDHEGFQPGDHINSRFWARL